VFMESMEMRKNMQAVSNEEMYLCFREVKKQCDGKEGICSFTLCEFQSHLSLKPVYTLKSIVLRYCQVGGGRIVCFSLSTTTVVKFYVF